MARPPFVASSGTLIIEGSSGDIVVGLWESNSSGTEQRVRVEMGRFDDEAWPKIRAGAQFIWDDDQDRFVVRRVRAAA